MLFTLNTRTLFSVEAETCRRRILWCQWMQAHSQSVPRRVSGRTFLTVSCSVFPRCWHWKALPIAQAEFQLLSVHPFPEKSATNLKHSISESSSSGFLQLVNSLTCGGIMVARHFCSFQFQWLFLLNLLDMIIRKQN